MMDAGTTFGIGEVADGDEFQRERSSNIKVARSEFG